MKKTQKTDSLRNIARQKVSFISIIVIAMLGVSIFLGLDYSAAALRRSGSNFYNRVEFRDIEAVSTLLFTMEDLDAIRQTEGVAWAEPVWQVSAKATSGGDRKDVDVISVTERLNVPQVEEGRLPLTDTECAVERELADEMGWTVGSEILLQSAAGSTVQYLKGRKFTVTGLADHPDHINTMVDVTYYVLVTPEAFDREALAGCFMKTAIAVEKAADTDRYSEAYRSEVETVSGRLESLAQVNAARRDTEVVDQFRNELKEKQEELDQAKADLADARAELDEGWEAFEEGERELADAEKKLERARKQLEDGWKELKDAKAQLDDGAVLLEEAKVQLDAAKKQLEDGWEALEDAKASVRKGMRDGVEAALGADIADSVRWAHRMPADVDNANATAMTFWITEEYSCDLNRSLKESITAFVYSDEITDEMLLEAYVEATGSEEGFNAAALRASIASAAVSATKEYEPDYMELQSACAAWDEGHSVYVSGLNEYNYQVGQYNDGLGEYNDGLAEYRKAKRKYEQGLRDYEEGKEKLEESRQKLEDGEAEYLDALPQIEEGERLIAEAREQLEDLDPCRWLILDPDGNPGYVQLRMGADNLSSLEITFALLFILVGTLVIFATISKMVDEQRTQVGTTKALGFFNWEIFLKYLSFGATAAVAGAVLGALAARFGLERFVLWSYNLYYTCRLDGVTVTALPTAVTLLASAGIAVVAIWAACKALLRTPAIRLMQPKIPAAAKRTGRINKGLSLYNRLILMNMRADIKRVLVTVVSVAGCCALVVIGVTLKNSMTGAMDRQFNGIADYDWKVSYSAEESATAGEEIGTLLRDAGAESVSLRFESVTYDFTGIQSAVLMCCDVDQVQDFYHLLDWKTGEPLSSTDEGILIQKRMAESCDLGVGSEFEISLGGSRTGKVKVAGIFDHYIGSPMVMSASYYEKVFRKECGPNAFFVRLNGADADRLEEALRAVKGFGILTASDADRATFDAATGVIDSLVALFIFMSAVMAGVVLMNLTNIYVLQKKRELTIMRVNGFTVREVINYMLRETVVTTGLGIGIGCVLGAWISSVIISTLEQPFTQFVRQISIPAWLIGAAVTLIFTALVNYIALKPVKDLKLTDVA